MNWPPQLPQVLDEIEGFVGRFMVFANGHQSAAVALWIFHTHLQEQIDATPYLLVTSAEMESGKTRLFEVASLLAYNSLMTSNISSAALFRILEEAHPTLFFDETDALFHARAGEKAEALRGIINAGHRRGNPVIRIVGEGRKMKAQKFDTFCPKAIAAIGDLPHTIQSRGIPIRLRRKKRQELVDRFRFRSVKEEAAPLVNRIIETVANVNIHDVHPEIPAEVTDRAEEVWTPLPAIAEVADSRWTERARLAAVILSAKTEDDTETIRTRLLTDIKAVFGDRDRLATRDLLTGLHTLEESPWGDNFGKPLTAHKLGRLLHPYEIHSKKIRIGDEIPKGFLREAFEDAWERYLSPGEPSNVAQGNNPIPTGRNADSEGGTDTNLFHIQNPGNANEDSPSSDVPPSEGAPGKEITQRKELL